MLRIKNCDVLCPTFKISVTKPTKTTGVFCMESLTGSDIFRVFSSFSERQGALPLDKLITEDTVPPLCLPATAQVVRLVPGSMIPKEDDQMTNKESEDEDPRQLKTRSPLGYLEVADVGRR